MLLSRIEFQILCYHQTFGGRSNKNVIGHVLSVPMQLDWLFITRQSICCTLTMMIGMELKWARNTFDPSIAYVF